MALTLLGLVRRMFSWRLPPHALSDDAFRSDILVEIRAYFELNTDTVESPGVLCEAFKAYIRGVLIGKQDCQAFAPRAALAH